MMTCGHSVPDLSMHVTNAPAPVTVSVAFVTSAAAEHDIAQSDWRRWISAERTALIDVGAVPCPASDHLEGIGAGDRAVLCTTAASEMLPLAADFLDFATTTSPMPWPVPWSSRQRARRALLVIGAKSRSRGWTDIRRSPAHTLAR
jgi:hypothetical protein